MHVWGDQDVDWRGIDEAASYIADFCRRYGRIGGQYKEKYGTVRFYATFADSPYSLFKPGYAYYTWPKWATHLDIYYGRRFLAYTGLLFIIHKWQKYVYGLAYRKAVKKWPHLREEILDCADWPELIGI